MDKSTLLAAVEFSRQRLLGILETIEKSGQDVQQVLSWRPGPGRAHIAWQAMHLAATHDRYLNVRLKGGAVKDEALVNGYGGGSTPSDQNVPSLATIRQKLEETGRAFKDYLAGLSAADLDRKIPGPPERSMGESIVLITWHEAHHQGQIHLTWNLYKAAHGVK